MNILISGVTGFLGSNLASHFLAKGNRVIGVIRSSSSLDRLDKVINNPNLTLVNVVQLEDIKENLDVIIHTATNYGRAGESLGVLKETNLELPLRLWVLGNQRNTKVFINTDTFMSFETPEDDKYYNYVVTKKSFLQKVKEKLNESKIKFVNVVVYHMYGPNDNPEKFIAVLIRRLLSNEPQIPLTSGVQKRDFIYISDVVDAFEMVVQKFKDFGKYEEFNIGTGEAHTVKESVELLKKILGSSSELLWGALENKQHDLDYGEASITHNNKLGWISKVSFLEGLQRTANYYKNKI